MGYPTFTFETDDEQFLLGTVQSLSDRLSVELDVMRYLISNVWYWRARLNITSMTVIPSDEVTFSVDNLGHASTENATLHYLDSAGEVVWHSPDNFSVNASNSSLVTLSIRDLELVDGGSWEIHYQKRVIDSATWVSEPVWDEIIKEVDGGGKGFLPAPGILISLLSAFGAAFASVRRETTFFQGKNAE
jgi:hypothetical protein